jgi:hypothetical protein
MNADEKRAIGEAWNFKKLSELSVNKLKELLESL